MENMSEKMIGYMVLGLFFFSVAIVIYIVIKLEKSKKRKESNIIREFKEKFKFKESNIDIDYFFNLGLSIFSVGHNKTIDNVFELKTKDETIFLLTYSYKRIRFTSRRYSNNYDTQTILLFQREDFIIPQFTLSPETLSDKINSLTSQDIDFKEYPKFSSMFLLKGREKAIRDFFTKEIFDHLTNKKNINLEGNNNSLIFYRKKKVVPLTNVGGFLSEGEEIFNLFIDAYESK